MTRNATGQEAANSTPPSASDEQTVHVAATGDLVLTVEREGRIDSAERSKVRLIPQAFGGPFEVVEVVKESGRVNRGEPLVRLKAEALEKELVAAEQAADHARRRLQIAREEHRIQQEQTQTRIEQVEKAKARAETELMLWEKFEGPKMLRSTELSLQQREFGLADEKEELKQLEEMYEGTHLASETKDIVLHRAQRGVKMSEAWLALGRNDNLIAREHRYPQRDQDVRDALRWAVQGDAHARVETSAANERKKIEIESAERGLRDAEERLADLKADQGLLTVVAPADGLLTPIDLEPRDVVSTRQVICEVLDPAALVMKFSANAEDLRVLNTGRDVTVVLPEFPEVEITGHIEKLAEVGTAAESATHFPVVVALKADDALVRIGLRCKVATTKTISDALTIPKTAVNWKNGRALCTIRTANGDEERELTVGPSNAKSIAVISGLAAGDEVIVEKSEAK